MIFVFITQSSCAVPKNIRLNSAQHENCKQMRASPKLHLIIHQKLGLKNLQKMYCKTI